MKTAQPNRPRVDRRHKTRRVHVKLTNKERVLFQHWYVFLRDTMHEELRKKKLQLFICKPKNKACELPKDAVREELRHIFRADWKCDLSFDDINKTIHMQNVR